MMTDPTGRDFFILCPNCGEEAVVSLQPGFNKADCPCCDFYLIIYLDADGRPYTRTPGVLASSLESDNV